MKSVRVISFSPIPPEQQIYLEVKQISVLLEEILIPAGSSSSLIHKRPIILLQVLILANAL